MSLRIGILRVATVIRGAGWIVAVTLTLSGVISGIYAGWQYPLLQTASADAAQKPVWERWSISDHNAPKEFSVQDVNVGYIFAGLIIGAILLGMAYVIAWILAGFAPDP